MPSKMISQEDLVEKYEAVEPVNGFILVEVTDKSSEYKRKSGLIIKQSLESNDRPYLIAVKLSKEALEAFPSLSVGDLLEVVDVTKLAMFFGKDFEQYGLVHHSKIAATYKKIKE